MSTCMTNEMAAYGLIADAENFSEPNPICPQMTGGNCCGKATQKTIETYWELDDKHQSYYHMAYLKMSKYLLGNGMNYLKLASYVIEKSKALELQGKDKPSGEEQGVNPDQGSNNGESFTFQYHKMCKEAAQKLVKIEYVDRRKVEGYYHQLNRKAEFMQNARRGFYCMLCNAKASTYIKTRRFNPLFDPTIYYSKPFCQMMYTHAFPAVFSVYKQWNPFMKYVMEMLMCIKPSGTESKSQGGQQESNGNQNDFGIDVKVNVNVNVDIDIPSLPTFNLADKNPIKNLPKKMKEFFENPMGVKAKGWMELCFDSDPNGLFFRLNCMGFCSEFRMTERSQVLDGDLDSMKILYDHVRSYEFAFETPNLNFFNDDVHNLKYEIHRNYKDLRSNYNFYRSLARRFDFSSYDTSFFPQLFTTPVDPMALSKGTTLKFKYLSEWLLKIVTIVPAYLYFIAK